MKYSAAPFAAKLYSVFTEHFCTHKKVGWHRMHLTADPSTGWVGTLLKLLKSEHMEEKRVC